MSLLILCYLLSSITFIVGLKMLSGPATARKGNLVAAAGMGLAILGTLFLYRDEEGNGLRNLPWISGAMMVGAVTGVVAARKVKMTAMPEMVSMFNGMGGLCAALVSVAEFDHFRHHSVVIMEGTAGAGILMPVGPLIIILLGMIIGSVSFAGSMVAWGKLNGTIGDRSFRGQQLVSLLVLLAIVIAALCLLFYFDPPQVRLLFYLVFALALLYGVLFVLPVGGADMPVVISLLNSFTGVAAACGGFLYNNMAMLTGGILVGAAGTLLTILMCRAMNRSLANVLIGSFGGGNGAGKPVGTEQGTIREISVSDAAIGMGYAHRVLIVPGYGLAVAQAQHTCHELEKLLEDRGVEVQYAIHPVAGRMPGHMNVLLAEADVSYDKLLEMERANELFAQTDVVLVLGANDVVNPAAKTDPASPVYGMPVLEVELAKTVIVNKRSMKPGYAGIENALFFSSGTSMLFGDAKQVLQELIAALKSS